MWILLQRIYFVLETLYLLHVMLQESMERARAILKTHAAEHKALAQALLEYETLDSEQIKTILSGKSLKKNTPKPSGNSSGGSKTTGTDKLPATPVPAALCSQSNGPLWWWKCTLWLCDCVCEQLRKYWQTEQVWILSGQITAVMWWLSAQRAKCVYYKSYIQDV